MRRACRKDAVHNEVVMPVPEASKEPWEMTREVYLAGREEELIGTRAHSPEMYYRRDPLTTTTPQGSRNRWEGVMGKYHQEFVEEALQEGKPVPSEVLADYPGLAEKYGEVVA